MRLAQLTLNAIDLLTLVAQRPFGLFKTRFGASHDGLQLHELLALHLNRFIGNEQTLAFALFLGRHLGQTVVDLRLPLAETVERLRNLERFNLNCMRPVLQVIEVLARFLQGILRINHACFDGQQFGLRLFDHLFALFDQAGEFLDLALPLKQAVLTGIRRKQGHALPADDIATRRHAARGRR